MIFVGGCTVSVLGERCATAGLFCQPNTMSLSVAVITVPQILAPKHLDTNL